MEISGVRQSLAYAGEEKYQMLELNRRLESYLNHVKLLEEENQLLWGEIQTLRRSQGSRGHVKRQDEALSLVRKEVQNGWKEKDRVELEISNLLAEIEDLNALRLREVAAQADAKRKVEESRKTLEDERRMQIWLREQAAHLEKEVSLQVQIHQEDVEAIRSSLVITKPVLKAPRHRQALNLQGLGEEYSQRAAQVWQEAAGKYQAQVEKLEEGLNQARTDMVQLNQEKRERKIQMQGFAQELEATKVKREILEKNMAQQRDQQKKELQHLQAHVEALETEKVEISEQIGELMADRRNLLQMKMSLGLEVATYRALLDNESCKDQRNSHSMSRNIRTVSMSERFTRPPGTYPAAQTLSSSLLSGPQDTTSRSIARKAHLMTQTSSGTLPRGTLLKTPKRAQVTQEEEVELCEEKVEVKSSAGSTKPFSVSDFLDHYRPSEAHEEPSCPAPVPVGLKAVDESEVKDEILEELLIDSTADAAQAPPGVEEEELIISQTGDLSGSPHTPEREESSSLHAEEAKSSEDGDEEVSTEMSQITHAPVSTWEVLEERDAVSEVELEYENVTENQAGGFTADVGLMEPKDQDENATGLAAAFYNQTEAAADSFGYNEENENEVERVALEDIRSLENISSSEGSEDLRDVEVPDFYINEYKQEKEAEFEGKQPELKTDKEIIDGDKQEKRSTLEISSVPEHDDEIYTEDTEQKSKPVMDTNLTHHHLEDQEQSKESLNLSNQSEESFSCVEEEMKDNIIQLVENALEEGIESLEGLGDLKGPDSDITLHKEANQPEFEEKTQLDPRTDGKEFIVNEKQEEMTEENVFANESIPQVSSEINAEHTEQKSEPVMHKTTHTRYQSDHFHTEEYQEQSIEKSFSILKQSADSFSNVEEKVEREELADVEEHIIQLVEKVPLMSRPEGGIERLEGSGDPRDFEVPGSDINEYKQENQAEIEEEKQSRTDKEMICSDKEDDDDINIEDTEQKSKPVMDTSLTQHHLEDQEQSKESLNLSNQSEESFSCVEEEMKDNIIQLVENVPLMWTPEEGIESLEKQEEIIEENTLDNESIPQVSSEINAEHTEQKSEPVMDQNAHTRYQSDHFHTEEDQELSIGKSLDIEPCYVEEKVEREELTDVEEHIIQLVEKVPLMSRPEEGIERLDGSGDLRDVEVPGSDINDYKQEAEIEEEEFIYSKKQERMMEESIPQVCSVPDVDHKANTEDAEQNLEPMVDTNDRDHAKEDQEQSDEESLNISASWRTDPGDLDQENTLADTRPLIHYRSDDEADGNFEISHQGTGEATDSEDEDRREGLGHWSQKISKRFDTMDDLSEEPEMGFTNDTVTDGSIQTVLEQDEMNQNMDEVPSQEPAQTPCEGLIQREGSGTDDELVCYPETDPTVVRDSSQPPEETSWNHNNDVPVEKPDESSNVDDWSESLPTDTSETTELQNPTDQFNSSEEDLIKDYTLNWDLESMEFMTEAENVNKPLFGGLSPVTDEPLVEQTIEEDVLEPSSMVATHTLEACSQELIDEHSSLSMLTDEGLPMPEHSSQQSQSESQTNVISSDVEESNSSEDESPNVSRCSHLPKHTEVPEIPTQQLDWNLSSTAGGSISSLLEEALKEGLESDDNHRGPHADGTENASCPDNEGELVNTQQWEDLAHTDESTAAPQHIEEAGDVDPNAAKDEIDIFESDLHEGSKEKENDPHTYFSSTITEAAWSTTQFQMAATYDQEPERFSNGSKDPSKGFGEDWEDPETLPAANGKPEKEMCIPTGQSEEDKEEEQVMGHAEKLLRKHVKVGQVDTGHVEESTDDGDSWSSGEE